MPEEEKGKSEAVPMHNLRLRASSRLLDKHVNMFWPKYPAEKNPVGDLSRPGGNAFSRIE